MIKINQITSPSQAARLRKRMDLGGICLARQKRAGSPCLTVDGALEVRRALSGVPVSVAFRQGDEFSLDEMGEILSRLQVDYFEFTPVDFAKTACFEEQLSRLERIRLPKVANGFFLLADDASLIQDVAGFERLQAMGVELFQFEVESVIDPDFQLDRAKRQRAEALFSRFRVLVTDRFEQIQTYPLKSVHGYFFNLMPTAESERCDGAETWPESRVLRLLMGKDGLG